MIRAEPGQIANWVHGRLLGPEADVTCVGLSTDTRTLVAGNLFVCLRGPNFDGHDFAEAAVAAGASAVVAERRLDIDVPQILVVNGRTALGTIGASWRARFHIPVLAVTGSNGKTTVKECLAAILRRAGNTLATRGNLNNDIGVPLMLSELGDEHAAAVLELGANHPGEIATLTRLVDPDVGTITNAAAAHLEGFGSVAGVARAKGELLAGLAMTGHAVYAADSEWTPTWRELAGARAQVTFGEDEGADVYVTAAADGALTLHIGTDSMPVEFPLPGAHNRRNAAAAAAAAWAAGYPPATIAAGLADVAPVPGRLVTRRGPQGSRLLDDSYNANPGSFVAALAVLGEADGPKWTVVGEMAELGTDTAAAHTQLGEQARAAGVTRLWAIGPSAERTCAGFGEGAVVAEDLDVLAAELRAALDSTVTLLIKGSRSNALERLVERLIHEEEG